MSAIHISKGDGQSKIYEEDQARALWMEGHFGDDAVFWREGMSDWQPVSILFPPTAVYQPTPAYRPEGQYTVPVLTGADKSLFSQTDPAGFKFTKNPELLTKVLSVMLFICLAINVVSLLSDFAQLTMAQKGGFTDSEAEANDARQSLIGMVYLGIFLVTGITFLKWIYRANLNCRGFGARDMQFTPGGSVGWYFIPFLNLVRPYQAMKEIWKVSTDPARWQVQEGSGILRLWWTFWILSNITGQITFRTNMAVKDLPSLETATLASITSGFVDIALTLVAIQLVSRITQKQVALTQLS